MPISEQYVQRLVSEERRRAIKETCFVEQQMIKRSLGPEQWKSVKRYLKNECAAIEKYGSGIRFAIGDDADPSSLTITNLEKQRRVELIYDDGCPCIKASADGESWLWTFKVVNNGAGLTFERDGQEMLAQDVARTISLYLTS